MATWMIDIRSELKGITRTLKELKDENSMLRKEILEIRNNSSRSSCDNCAGIMKTETLCDMMGRIELEVGKIKEAIKVDRTDNFDVQFGGNGRGQVTFEEKDESNCSEIFEESTDSFEKSTKEIVTTLQESVETQKPVWIRTKKEEDRRLLARLSKLKLREEMPWDGSTLARTTVESISSSIKITEHVASSIVLIISNHLPLAIKSIEEFGMSGRRTRGPSEIRSQMREAFSLEGNSIGCSFLYAFKISASLKLVVCSETLNDGSIILEAGFTPLDIPLDYSLISTLELNAHFPPGCFSTGGWLNETGAKCLISKGDYLAHITMTSGPKSIVRVGIWEDTSVRPHPTVESMIRNGKSVGDVAVVDYLNQSLNPIENLTLLPVACVVEIVNGLEISLKNGQIFMRQSNCNVCLPKEVGGFTREMFSAAHESMAVGIFSYEIEETDLKILIAFKCKDGENNSFSTSIVEREIQLNEESMQKLLNPSTWKTLESMRYAEAEDGEQLVLARNVRVTASMSSGKISTLKIFVFCI